MKKANTFASIINGIVACDKSIEFASKTVWELKKERTEQYNLLRKFIPFEKGDILFDTINGCIIKVTGVELTPERFNSVGSFELSFEYPDCIGRFGNKDCRTGTDRISLSSDKYEKLKLPQLKQQ